jgi:cobalt-zinc-cadmium efflux system protein
MPNHNHDHNHDHTHNHSHSVTDNIALSFVINTSFALIELVGGIYTNSQAVISDALHDFGDSISLGLGFWLEKKSVKGKTDKYNYGQRRFSLLAGLVSGGVLIAGSIYIVVTSIAKIQNPEKVNFQGVIILAIFGVLMNGAVYLKSRRGKSINEKFISFHFLEDALGWIAVLASAVFNLFYNLPVLDSILSIAIALFTLYRVYQTITQTFHILLQGVPVNLDIRQVRALFIDNPLVSEFHDLNVWSMDGQEHIMSVHIVINDDTSTTVIQDLKHKLKHDLEHLGIIHATLEIETVNEQCHQKIKGDNI